MIRKTSRADSVDRVSLWSCDMHLPATVSCRSGQLESMGNEVPIRVGYVEKGPTRSLVGFNGPAHRVFPVMVTSPSSACQLEAVVSRCNEGAPAAAATRHTRRSRPLAAEREPGYVVSVLLFPRSFPDHMGFNTFVDNYYRLLARIRSGAISKAKGGASRDGFVRDAARMFEVEPRMVEDLFGEVRGDPTLERVRQRISERRQVGRVDGTSSAFDLESLYALTRLSRARTIVETGVLYGGSSAYFLAALERNGDGHLFSFDLPRDGTPEDTGNLVPDSLRHRWTLTLGDARSTLPAFFEDVSEIDLFNHDSLHLYSHMLWEYRTAWQHIRPGGLLTSHDVLLNPAFPRFAQNTREVSMWFTARNLGVARRAAPP